MEGIFRLISHITQHPTLTIMAHVDVLSKEDVPILIHKLFTEDEVDVRRIGWPSDIVNEDAMRRVAQALKEDNVQVKFLRLSFDTLTIQAAHELSDALRINTTIETLFITSLCLGSIYNLSVLLEGVGASSCISSLTLSAIDFDAAALVDCLCSSSSIESFSIEGSPVYEFTPGMRGFSLGKKRLAVLVKALSNGSLSHIKELRIVNCQIDSAGAAQVARMLEANTTLKVLNLDENISIKDNGAKALTKALWINTTLKKLYLTYCSLSTASAVALAGLLKKTNSLECLGLTLNYSITVKGHQALADACSCNTSLVELHQELPDALRQLVGHNLEMNRVRKTFMEKDRSTISAALYQLIFARVSAKPSVLFLLLQENRDMFIPHLPDPSGLW
jgi:hypothetical protein